MSEQPQRIPDVDRASLPPQDVQVVDESFAGSGEDFSPSSVHWLRSYNRLNAMRAADAPPTLIENLERGLDDEVLLDLAQGLFRSDAVSAQFDELITQRLLKTGELDAALEEMKPFEEPIEDKDQLKKVRYHFASVFMDWDVSADVRRRLVEIHADAINAADKELEILRDKDELFFTEALAQGVADGIFPQSALVDEKANPVRAKRIKSTRLKVSDPVYGMLEGQIADYVPEENLMRVDALIVDQPELRRTIFAHERLHSYAGVFFRVQDDDLPLGNPVDEGFDWSQYFEKSGKMSRHVIDDYMESPQAGRGLLVVSRNGLGSRHHDIDEGYTEWAALTLTGKGYDHKDLWDRFTKGESIGDLAEDFSGVYLEERIMLAGLVASGVDIMAIGEAYFESYEPKRNHPERQSGLTAPKRRELDKAIAKHTPYKSLEQMQARLRASLHDLRPNLHASYEAEGMALLFALQMNKRKQAA